MNDNMYFVYFAVIIIALIVVIVLKIRDGKRKNELPKEHFRPADKLPETIPDPAPSVNPAPPVNRAASVNPASPVNRAASVKAAAPVNPAAPIDPVPDRGMETVLLKEVSGPETEYADPGKTEFAGSSYEPYTYELVLKDKNNAAIELKCILDGDVVLGRKHSRPGIIIGYEKSVSAEHCRISGSDGNYFVQDLNSTNHTLLNGTRVNDAVEINTGDVLTLGRAEFQVFIRPV